LSRKDSKPHLPYFTDAFGEQMVERLRQKHLPESSILMVKLIDVVFHAGYFALAS
jgi:hypothetical protein